MYDHPQQENKKGKLTPVTLWLKVLKTLTYTRIRGKLKWF